ncbi:MAG: hypothetical protein ABSD97_13730 [Acidimicrobiales bacterium]|jgi:photosystem II stability/assembly factor-like uncharacterized protein
MDESSDDIDQIFKRAAQHAAAIACVLDPTRAIERGAKRRSFARRRKMALSGAVVLALVVVFLVPLPQLHLFGTGGSGTSTGPPTTLPATRTGPIGGRVPAGFEPRSFTAVNREEWWLLGFARCLAGAGTCGEIVRTTDGGSSFVGIPAPPVSASEVTQLSFANALDGYAFDPELWETTSGGTSWVKLATAGPVAQLEVADGEAYALGCTAADCSSSELLRSPVGSLNWQRVPTPVPLEDDSSLTVSGTDIYVLGGETGSQRMRIFLLRSEDKGASFAERVDPCTPGLGGRLTAAANGHQSLWAVCPTGTEAKTWLSNDGGRSWIGLKGGFPNSVQLVAASSSVALVSPALESNGNTPDALVRTTDGGRSFAVVLSGSATRVLWLGFTNPSRAYGLFESSNSAVVTTQLYESNDGGATWHRVAIKT